MIGIIAFIAYTYSINLIVGTSETVAFALIMVVLGSIIPDILEPPTNWMHRGLGHSKRALKLTGIIFVLTALIGLFISLLYIISSFFLGYAFHLLADSITEVGLPD